MQAGNSKEALRVVALILGDMRRATAFCQASGSQDAFMTLLAMLLHPGEGRDPLYTEACQLLAAQGSIPYASELPIACAFLPSFFFLVSFPQKILRLRKLFRQVGGKISFAPVFLLPCPFHPLLASPLPKQFVGVCHASSCFATSYMVPCLFSLSWHSTACHQACLCCGVPILLFSHDEGGRSSWIDTWPS